MPVISIATQKGGTGKTTITVNLGAALQRKGYSVLLIDSDPQANLTYSLGVPDSNEKNLFSEYKKEISGQRSDLQQVIIKTESSLNLIPSTPALANAELELVSKIAREQLFRNRMLNQVKNDFDFIFIDCPPSFGLLTINSLVASDQVLIPLQGEFLPQKGVESFLQQFYSLKENLNLGTGILGFILTRFSPRKTMNRQIREWLESNFTDKLFQTFIHTDINLAAAQKKGLDIFSYSPRSVAAADFEALANEFIQKIRAGTEITNRFSLSNALNN